MVNISETQATYYSKPGPMTDPKEHAHMLNDLPDDLGSLCRIVQNSLVHVFWAERIGIKLKEERKRTQQLRRVSEKLAAIKEDGYTDLTEPRSLERKQVSNCRDYSVLLTSILRHKGRPARARCGFGTYFKPGKFIDHWIVEYWDGKRWVGVDSQIDNDMLREFGITFDPLDVPHDKFIDAGRAWGMCRRGEADPKDFGIQDMNGPIFVWGDVMRDVLSLSKVEILPWDGGWGFLDHRLDDPLPDEETLLKYDYIARLASQANDRFEELIEVTRLEPGLRTPAEWGIPGNG